MIVQAIKLQIIQTNPNPKTSYKGHMNHTPKLIHDQRDQNLPKIIQIHFLQKDDHDGSK